MEQEIIEFTDINGKKIKGCGFAPAPECKDINLTNPIVLSRWQDPTIEEQNNKLEKIKEIVNNDKICGIEAKLMIKDILEGVDK